MRIRQVTRAGLTFPVRDHGPLDGDVAVLLHGFPEASGAWAPIADALAARGVRTLAVDQRGYAATARPPRVRDYRIDELVADVVALVDEAAAGPVHVVGHDWGGTVAWHLAGRSPDRVKTLTVLSTPHPRALAASLFQSSQALRSSYAACFQLPVLPESLLLAAGGALLRRTLRASGLDGSATDEVVAAMSEPAALRAALDWYRAALRHPSRPLGTIRVPTTYLWSDRDAALGRRAADLTARWVDAPYRFEVVHATHWIQHDVPDAVVAAVCSQVG